ncbi:hypothetical protein EJ02DRAFT_441390 [Clathrospora elynae]|uniref:Peptide N-acetyl-beta-D-glucosaminyl asparaginase amidase A N-terminal domain-containing protein n=1 Tax=Clathrospora elynae TaxID=706981 RepID=A0A6A5T1Q6_9PLEO|nr:hypothetical protein EJ02DRAFT_441390 [Clathrospora elynae]
MGGNTEYIAGHGYLSLGQAVHVAQNSEGGVDQHIAQFLEKRLAEVWSKLNVQPQTYILPSDEFALMNYYRTRFGDNEIVRNATKRLGTYRTIPLTTEFTAFCAVVNRYWSGMMYFQEQRSNAMPAWRNEVLSKVEMLKASTAAVVSNGPFRPVSLFLMLMTLSQSTLAFLTTPAQSLSSRATNDSSPLQCLQVAPPIRSPSGGCQQMLMVHTFAYSYGQPFVGDYIPPNCDFNRVSFNFTVSSAGRQFDRLALMFFDDTEIFRTSTAEPTETGIVWTYEKDMSNYLSLFQKQQKIIFDLGNIIDDTYTGLWYTTLTANFFTAEDMIQPADMIVPISARRSLENMPSGFVVPDTSAVNTLVLPQNAKKAVFSISSCGQAAEEFWWSNVLSSDTHAFGNDTTLYGHSPFRELQLFIDGYMAGVAWPFPVIFTGGVVPGFWRPIVGIDAFDLREDEIDITPFLPLFSDGKNHTFEIRVVGIDDNGHGNGNLTSAIESNWVVTGKVFVWLDTTTNRTTGTFPQIRAPAPSIKLASTTQQSGNGTVDALDYSIQVSRYLHVETILNTLRGPKAVTWTQNLTFSNSGTLSNQGNDQVMRQLTTGTSSTFAGYYRTFEYPLQVTSFYNAPAVGNLTINATMGRGKNFRQSGDLAFPNEWKTFDYSRLPSTIYGNRTFFGSDTKNWQNGTAAYVSDPVQKKSFGYGSTEQQYSLSGVSARPGAVVQYGTKELYRRHIVVANYSIIYDEESFGDQVRAQLKYDAPSLTVSADGMHEFAKKGVGAMLGRGPV